jgi:WD40 repeat protein/HEAT repeat protein
MPRPDKTLVQSDHGAAQRWLAVLNNRIPLAGSWLRRQSAEALAQLSLDGDRAATRILAQALDNHPDALIRQFLHEHFSTPIPSSALDAAWEVWVETRREGIAEVLTRIGRPAAKPPAVRALSALFLQNDSILQNAAPDLVEPLIHACEDPDPLLSSRARFALTQLKNPEAISVLCRMWVKQRLPILEGALTQAGYQPLSPPEARVLVALKYNRLDLITFGEPDVLPPLLTACEDQDEDIRARAQFCLLNLQSPAAVNALCGLWVEQRSTWLSQAVAQTRYVASRPTRIRLLSALKAGRQEIAQKVSAEGVPILVEALKDQDPQVAERSLEALHHLQTPEARDRLCQIAIEQDHPQASQICLESEYLPTLPEQRALFLFLNELWAAYDTLDFDQRLLNLVYQSSEIDIRQRILRKVQQAGRTDFLNILTGSDDRARAAHITPIESELLVRVLAANQEWERLWKLAQELALPNCIEIIHILVEKKWQPNSEAEVGVFAKLVQLSNEAMIFRGQELIQLLPLAVPCATLHLHGRMNALIFAPDCPMLAIGTGAGQVALWNFQQARMDRVLKGFAHSISSIVYTPGGTLVFAERTSSKQPCHLYLYYGGSPTLLGQHQGSITGLALVSENELLSIGRDAHLKLWNLKTGATVNDRSLEDWPRSICISTDASKALLLSEKPEMVTLPGLEILPDFGRVRYAGARVKKGISHCAAFLPGKNDFLTGQFNGQVIAYQNVDTKPRLKVLTNHKKCVEGIRYLPGRDILLTAGAEGQVHFFQSSDLQAMGTLVTPADQLTSLQISPDSAMMATGSNESTLVLWDLRVLDIPTLFSQPLASILPKQMAAVNALVENASLPGAVHNALVFLQNLLQFRFRYDIQVADLPLIQAGEFDIIVE